MPDKRFLALASHEAGDLSVLLGFGVPHANILLVDKDKAAIASARFKFPGAMIQEGDIVDVAGNYPMFDAAFLDFCGYITKETIIKVHQVISGILNTKGYLGLGVMIGRESVARLEFADTSRRFYNALDSITPNERKRITDIPDWEEKLPYLIRTMYILEQFDHLKEEKIFANLLRIWTYSSSEKGSKGVPMLTLLIKFTQKPQADLIQRLLVASEHPLFSIPEKEATSMLADRALKSMDDGERADLLYNLSAGSLAALRAHQTRGTYAKPSAGKANAVLAAS
jgi:hypothetical protein